MWFFILNKIKNILFIALLFSLGYFIYTWVHQKDYEIKDKMIVYHAQSLNSKSMELIPLTNYVNIKGVMTNKSQRYFKDIIIYYSLGKDTLTAKIYDLMPGQEMKFMTNYCFIDKEKPPYKLAKVSYKTDSN